LADVRFEQATKIYAGTDAPAVDALDLHIENGEFVVLVGPSGSGKTTALRMLAGLEEVDAGAIYIGDRDVTDLAPKKRDVAMVFQNYALYPYLTVEANIGFPLRIARVKKEERAERVLEVARMLGLEPYLQRKPGQLSGGQRQRVAMGRDVRRDRRGAPPCPHAVRADGRNPTAGRSRRNSAGFRRARCPRRWHAPYARGSCRSRQISREPSEGVVPLRRCVWLHANARA